MAKTLEKFYLAPNEPRAIVLLDDSDLRALDAIERDSGYASSWKWKKDPAEALRDLLVYERRVAARIVTEGGMVEVIVYALQKFKAWAEAARVIRKPPLGIWMEIGRASCRERV